MSYIKESYSEVVNLETIGRSLIPHILYSVYFMPFTILLFKPERQKLSLIIMEHKERIAFLLCSIVTGLVVSIVFYPMNKYDSAQLLYPFTIFTHTVITFSFYNSIIEITNNSNLRNIILISLIVISGYNFIISTETHKTKSKPGPTEEIMQTITDIFHYISKNNLPNQGAKISPYNIENYFRKVNDYSDLAHFTLNTNGLTLTDLNTLGQLRMEEKLGSLSFYKDLKRNHFRHYYYANLERFQNTTTDTI